jgi:hypothetical protein
MMRRLVLVLIAAALAAPAAGASSAAGGGAERVHALCVASYSPEDGTWFGFMINPDTPEFFPGGPDGPGPFAYAGGTAVFTPSGNMEVNRQGEANLVVSPPFDGRGDCFAVRGGDEFGHGAQGWSGEGELVVTPSGNVSMSCHASFTGILP